MIPVSILTGFLGSGKTTILAHLMRDPALADTAVIINEFGDVGLDHDLIETSDETLVTLATGCLCCKIQGDLVATLHDLLARRDAGTVPQFSRVVIETSGLADPAPILQGLMVDDGLAGRVALARVVTAADAVNGVATLMRQAEARKQVAVADQLVLTKMDLAAGGGTAGLHSTLRALNPSAPLAEVSHGALDVATLFPDGDAASDAFGVVEVLARAHDVGHDRTPGHASGHEHAHDNIATFAIVREAPVAAVALSLFLEALADHCGADLLRLKGLVRITEYPAQPAVIHGVQHVFHPPVWLGAWPSADTRTRIVFIARGLSEEWTRALLAAIELEVEELEFEGRADEQAADTAAKRNSA